MTFAHARRSVRRYVRTYLYPAAAVLMILKFAQYFKTGRGSQVAFVLYRDGFMEFTSKSQKQVYAL
jgi:hypothetical protein